MKYFKNSKGIQVQIPFSLQPLTISRFSNMFAFHPFVLLPPVLIVSVVYYGLSGSEDFSHWLSEVFLYGFYIKGYGGGVYWYFALLIPAYLAYPFIHQAINRYGFRVTLVLIGLVTACAALLYYNDPEYYDQIEIALTRVPSFICGALLGKHVYQRREVPLAFFAFAPMVTIAYIICMRSGLLSVQSLQFLWRYQYLPLAILVVMDITLLTYLADSKGRAFALLGTYSLECYLIYESLYLGLYDILKTSDTIGITYVLEVFILTLVLSIALKAVCKELQRTAAQLR